MRAGTAVSMDRVITMMDGDGSHPEEEAPARRWLRWLAFGAIALVVVLTLARLAGLLNSSVKIEADGEGGAYSVFQPDLYQAPPTTVEELHIGPKGDAQEGAVSSELPQSPAAGDAGSPPAPPP